MAQTKETSSPTPLVTAPPEASQPERRRWRRRERPSARFRMVGLFSALAVVACMFVGATAAARSWVESEVKTAVRTALKAEGLQGLKLKVRGQHVELSGSVPEAQLNRAHELIRTARGPTWLGQRVAPVAVSTAAVTIAPSLPELEEPKTRTESTEGDTSKVSALPRPGSPEAAAACELRLADVLHRHPIQFGVNSAELNREAQDTLDKAADVIQTCARSRIRVEGHTDASGSAPANQSLSETRSQAVLDGLIARGVDPARITSFGFGPSRPLVPGTSAQARALNRRIELKVEAVTPAGKE